MQLHRLFADVLYIPAYGGVEENNGFSEHHTVFGSAETKDVNAYLCRDVRRVTLQVSYGIG